ncbi:ABC transporter ATP-binding protein [Bradyrhizobium erythrophlei]|uniref:NitT/TauT family transport system ATP-binding protein n=1 Tax=Bradyrhizobium erythrophlei TaxID=1437360 RepID=A0A1M7TQM4_9BRAD|nr:ABC transporter ATP-binding protein [Bradyrhizobium erythrophlei]SHN72976.1 NitT/TauT family transport system ATP-binding protein [Bradyrhizobium erythrophlei]
MASRDEIRGAGGAPRILLDNVSVSYATQRGRLLVVDRVSLAVDRAEFVVLVGPSGCGKSTILRAIAGLNAAESGIISVDGKKVDGPPEHIGFMFQRDTLLPWLTVRGNIEVGLELAGVPSAQRTTRIADLLTLLRLSEFHDAYPAQLSGGMRHRVSLGRMLAYQPAVMLMDEPFGALDFQTKAVMGRELLRIWETERRSILFVTHDIEEAVALADRVLVFSPRPARIVAEHRIDLARPRNLQQLRTDPAFTAYTSAIWETLGDGEPVSA